MPKKKNLNLDQFTKKVGAKVPKFAKALREEEAYLQFCNKVRQDLRQLRKDMGVNQTDVAAELQMSQPGVSKIEKGDGDIGLLTLCRYAGALGMQPTISFAPTASTYLEKDALRATLRAMERLSESRVARADDTMHARYRALTLGNESAAAVQGLLIMNAVAASVMNGVIAQSLSTEIVSIMSTISGFPPELAERAKEEQNDEGHLATS